MMIEKNELLNRVARLNIRDLEEILPDLKKYILQGMARDFKNIPEFKRQTIASEIIFFIRDAIKKGYITSRNIQNCLTRIINTVSHFEELTDPNIYGEIYRDSCFKFNFSSNIAWNNRKHVVYHEMTHAISSLIGQNTGIYDYNLIMATKPSSEVSSQSVQPQIRIQKNKIVLIPIMDDMNPFLNEIMAEPTACDLAETYDSRKTPLSAGCSSDWLLNYNRAYQTLGYEFLQTLMHQGSMSERELFKAFTKKVIDSGGIICEEIMRVYEQKHPDTWKEDLHEIASILGELASKHILVEAKVNRARQLMSKYRNIRIIAKEPPHRITIK